MEPMPHQKHALFNRSCVKEDCAVIKAKESSEKIPDMADMKVKKTAIQAKDVFSLLDKFEASEYLQDDSEEKRAHCEKTNLYDELKRVNFLYACKPLRMIKRCGTLNSPLHISPVNHQQHFISYQSITPPPSKEHDYCKQNLGNEEKIENELEYMSSNVTAVESDLDKNASSYFDMEMLEDTCDLNPFRLEHPRIISTANHCLTVPNPREKLHIAQQELVDKRSPNHSLVYYARNKPNRLEKEKQYVERRIVYVGKISNETTPATVKDLFSDFGPVEEVSVHFRNNGDNFGFVTFFHREDAFEAVENGKKDPKWKKFDISFGGRRHFCKTHYADLDSASDRYSRRCAAEVDFDTLLKKAKADMKYRSLK